MKNPQEEFWPVVIQAVPASDYWIYAYFNDGTVRQFDMKPLIQQPNSVFSPLAERALFESRLTVINDTVAWDMGGDRDPRSCLDLDPFTLYETEAIKDPLTQ
jgi:hypothetical protein